MVFYVKIAAEKWNSVDSSCNDRRTRRGIVEFHYPVDDDRATGKSKSNGTDTGRIALEEAR